MFPEADPKVVGRCTHAGSWKGSNALAVAEQGYIVLLHEFNEASGLGRDVCTCGGTRISEDDTLWPPIACWSNRRLQDVTRFEELQRLADVTSSPFAFHVASSRLLFPNVTLLSPFLLERIGEAKLCEVLDAIKRESPEQFYRLINKAGVTRRLVKFDNGQLLFDDNTRIATEMVVENVLASFREMRELQRDPTYVLPVRERVVLDSHFYVVMIAVATHQDGVAVHLSGRHTYQYMFTTAEAKMHRVRNDRLFRLVARILGLSQLQFSVHLPPVDVSLKDQYSV